MNNALYDRVKELCNTHEININQLESELGFGKSSILKWKISRPSSDAIIKVAKYFNVSTDYLMGLSNTETPTIFDNDIITIHRAHSKMSNEDKTEMMKMLKNTFNYAFEEGKDEDTI